MYVWMILRWYGGTESSLWGIYSSQEKAEQAAVDGNKTNLGIFSHSIEKWEVDE